MPRAPLLVVCRPFQPLLNLELTREFVSATAMSATVLTGEGQEVLVLLDAASGNPLELSELNLRYQPRVHPLQLATLW